MVNVFYENFHKKTFFQKKLISTKNFTYRDLLDILNKYTKPKSKILDIGCGAGTIDFFLANRGNFVTGIDVSLKAINSCKKSSRIMGLEDKLKFFQMNFPENTPSGLFDLIIVSEVLEHIVSEEKSIISVKNSLQKNGVVIISVPSASSLLYKFGFLEKFDKKVGHLRRYTTTSLSNLFKKNGFSIIEIKKTEGILRNSLFVFQSFDLFIKILNKFDFLSEFVSFLDKFFIKIFGESNIILVAKAK